MRLFQENQDPSKKTENCPNSFSKVIHLITIMGIVLLAIFVIFFVFITKLVKIID